MMLSGIFFCWHFTAQTPKSITHFIVSSRFFISESKAVTLLSQNYAPSIYQINQHKIYKWLAWIQKSRWHITQIQTKSKPVNQTSVSSLHYLWDSIIGRRTAISSQKSSMISWAAIMFSSLIICSTCTVDHISNSANKENYQKDFLSKAIGLKFSNRKKNATLKILCKVFKKWLATMILAATSRFF